MEFTTAVLEVSSTASVRQSPEQLSGMEQRMTAVTTKFVICVTLIYCV